MPVYDNDIKLGEVFEVEEGDTLPTVYLRDIKLSYDPRPDDEGVASVAVKVTPYDEDGDDDEQAPQFFLRPKDDEDFDPTIDGPVYYINVDVDPEPVVTLWQAPSSGSNWATETFAYDAQDDEFVSIYTTATPIARDEESMHPVVVPHDGVNDLFMLEGAMNSSNTQLTISMYASDTAGEYPPTLNSTAIQTFTINAVNGYWTHDNHSLHAACYDPVNDRIIIYFYAAHGGNTNVEHLFIELKRGSDGGRASWECKQISRVHSSFPASTLGFTGIVPIPSTYDNADGTLFIGNNYTGSSANNYRDFRQIEIPTGLGSVSTLQTGVISDPENGVVFSAPTGWNSGNSSDQIGGRCLAMYNNELWVTYPPSDASSTAYNTIKKVRMFDSSDEVAPTMIPTDDSDDTEILAVTSGYTGSIDLFAMFPNQNADSVELELVSASVIDDEILEDDILADNRYIPSGDGDRGSPKQVRFQFITEDDDNEYALPTSVTVDEEETDLTFDDNHEGEQYLLGQFTTLRSSTAPDDAKTNLTLSALREIHSPHISPWASLLTLWVGDRDDPDFIRRYTTYNEPIIHDGNVFVPHQFTATFPPRTRSTEVEVSLSLTNIDDDLNYLLTADTQYVQAESIVVRVHEPSVAQYGPVSHVYRELKQGSNRLIQMTGKIIDIIDDPAVDEQYTPAYFPGLF